MRAWTRQTITGSLALTTIALGLIAYRTLSGIVRDAKVNPPVSRPRPSTADWLDKPTVSVLVAAWNEAENIEPLIRSFAALSYPHRQLLVCAGGTDDTLDRARSLVGSNIVVDEQRPGDGKQGALRRLLPQARGSIIFLTDADCILSDEAFERTIEPLVVNNAAAATGAAGPKPHQRRIPLVRYQWLIDRSWYAQRPETVDGLLGRNCAIRRDVLTSIGGFDAPAPTGTDYVLGKLLILSRYEIRSVPESRIQTEYPSTFAGYLRMWRRWNKNLLVHGPRFGAWSDVEGLLIAAVSAAAPVVTLAAAVVIGPFTLAVALPLFAVAVANRVRRVVDGARLAGMAPPLDVIVRTPLYTAIDLASAIGAIADAARSSTRTRW